LQLYIPGKKNKYNISIFMIKIYRVIKSRKLRCSGHVDRMEKERSAFKISPDKPTGNTRLERPRRRWEENVRMDLKERYQY
jgi:hypothetical protein